VLRHRDPHSDRSHGSNRLLSLNRLLSTRRRHSGTLGRGRRVVPSDASVGAPGRPLRTGRGTISMRGRADEPSTCICGSTQLHSHVVGNDSDPLKLTRTVTIARRATSGYVIAWSHLADRNHARPVFISTIQPSGKVATTSANQCSIGWPLSGLSTWHRSLPDHRCLTTEAQLDHDPRLARAGIFRRHLVS